MLLFEWDPDKAKQNITNHGITFDEASTAFKDDLSLISFDPLHSTDEDRFVLIGNSMRNNLLVIIHTDRSDRIRIISARKATKNEKQQYEDNAKRSGNAGRV
jgi:uncharacterized DUF497 family protein